MHDIYIYIYTYLVGTFNSFIHKTFLIVSRIVLNICVANMASYAISSSLIFVIHDNMIIGTNLIVLACLCRHF
jgi:hypothetical protein